MIIKNKITRLILIVLCGVTLPIAAGKISEIKVLSDQEIKKKDGLSLFDIGNSQYLQGNKDQGEKNLLKAAGLLKEIKDADGEVFNTLGKIYYLLEQLTEVEEYYKKAVEQNSVKAFYNLGNLYCKKRDFKSAVKYYLLAGEKGDSDGYVMVGKIYESAKKDLLAKKYYLQASEQGNKEGLDKLINLYKDALEKSNSYDDYEQLRSCYEKNNYEQKEINNFDFDYAVYCIDKENEEYLKKILEKNPQVIRSTKSIRTANTVIRGDGDPRGMNLIDYMILGSTILNPCWAVLLKTGGFYWLKQALLKKKFSEFETLLQRGANINSRDENGTLLHYLAQQNSVDIKAVKNLLSNQINKHIKDNSGKTAYQRALDNKNVDFLKLVRDYQTKEEISEKEKLVKFNEQTDYNDLSFNYEEPSNLRNWL